MVHRLVLGAFLAAGLLAGCSGSDSHPGDVTRACDRSADPAVAFCTQATGPAVELDAGRSDCTSAGGAWTNRCPAAPDLIGCCSYVSYGFPFSECFYPKTPAWQYGPESYCNGLTVNGDPAVWTTTVP